MDNTEKKQLTETIRKIAYRLEMLKFYSSPATLYRWEKACNFMGEKETPTEKQLALDISPDQLSLFEDSTPGLYNSTHKPTKQ